MAASSLDDLLAPSTRASKTERINSFKKWLDTSESAEVEALGSGPAKKRSKPGSEADSKWWQIPEQTMTPEVKRDLQIIQARGYLDPKRFYKVRATLAGLIVVPTILLFSG